LIPNAGGAELKQKAEIGKAEIGALIDSISEGAENIADLPGKLSGLHFLQNSQMPMQRPPF
jgi:hypothetical protein